MGDANQQRFLELIRPHEPRLYALARQYAGSAEDARDLFQEALLRAWRGFAKAPQGQYGGGWLAVILRRIAIDWHRRGRGRLRERLTERVGADRKAEHKP